MRKVIVKKQPIKRYPRTLKVKWADPRKEERDLLERIAQALDGIKRALAG